MLRIAWTVFAIFCAAFSAHAAYQEPARFAEVVDLVATVISILISVSLALMAFLCTPFSVANDFAKDGEERKRIDRTIARDDSDFFDGQLILFAVFFIALGALLVLKWYVVIPDESMQSKSIQILSAIAAFFSVLSFFWAALLPSMLRALVKQRREFG